MQASRQDDLGRIRALLNTPDGEFLMDELRSTFKPQFAGRPPHEVQYLAGQADMLDFLEMLSAGDFIDE